MAYLDIPGLAKIAVRSDVVGPDTILTQRLESIPPDGSIVGRANTVASTPTALPTAGNLALRRWLRIQNPQTAAQSIFLGGSTVTATTGFEIFPGGDFEFEIGPTAVMYGIVAAGSQTGVITLERAA